MDPITGSILSGVIGGIGSIIGGRTQARAAKKASQAQERTANRQLDLSESIYRDQVQRNEPFRQMELQQANAFGELFGFAPTSGPVATAAAPAANPFDSLNANQYGRMVLMDPQLYRQFNTLSGKEEKKIGRAGFDLNSDGNLSLEEFGAYIADRRGGVPQSAFNPTPSTAGTGRDLTMPTAAPVGEGTTLGPANDGGRSRFENSIFFDLGQIGLNEGGGTGDPYERFMNSAFADVARSGARRDVDRIDSALGAQGALFSSSRQAYADDAFADRMAGAFTDFINNDRFAAQQQRNAFSDYVATLMGSPPQTATNNANALAANYNANAANAFANIGNAQAAGAIGRGNAIASGIQGVGEAVSGALGMFGGNNPTGIRFAPREFMQRAFG